MTRSAFTLIELLVVMAIVAVLAGIATPVSRRVMHSARATACVSNERQLGAALNLYLAENNMTMPTLAAGRRDKNEEAAVIDNTLNRYVQDARIFACPADAQGFAANTGTSYYWNVALNGQAVSGLHFLFTEDMTRIPILSDKEGFHLYADNKVNLLYADGHATQELTFFTGGK
ncbi:MAG: hypothetical protein QOD99_3000 [Chthoniobacter sp.]|jgi:prepilin-type N-terminal cleavage/methylation domain-containing protein/prepilin-type processing-associated H-X9-DG protein|nr:hypothetical protein [Chthoniobacter sp.]